jgi:archaellum component FlaC
METVSNISNPFMQTTPEDSKNEKEKKVLRARSNLEEIVKQVTYNETKDLLGDVQHNTIGLCEFSCGKSNCYVCNLFYGKSAK